MLTAYPKAIGRKPHDRRAQTTDGARRGERTERMSWPGLPAEARRGKGFEGASRQFVSEEPGRRSRAPLSPLVENLLWVSHREPQRDGQVTRARTHRDRKAKPA